MSNPEVDFELSERGRAFATRLANNPLDLFQGKTLGWLEDFIRITVGNIEVGAGAGGTIGTHTVGHLAWICKDLTAHTGEYVYEDDSGQYLYLNGASVEQIIYPDLYEFYGPNAYGTDAGGFFLLPDARGRAPFICGTNPNADLGDNDGISITLRQALHQHAVTGTVASHSHTDGTLTVAAHSHTVNDPAHAHVIPFLGGFTSANGYSSLQGVGNAADSQALTTGSEFTGITIGNASPDVTGSTGSASPAVTGTAGSGMSLDAPAHIFIGSLLVRF